MRQAMNLNKQNEIMEMISEYDSAATMYQPLSDPETVVVDNLPVMSTRLFEKLEHARIHTCVFSSENYDYRLKLLLKAYNNLGI